MGPITSIQLPIFALACRECQSKQSGERSATSIPFFLTRVDVGGEEIPPLTIEVNVERVSWKRQKVGQYAAEATVSMICPCCQNPRELQAYLEAPLIVLTNLGKCRNCNGALDVEAEEIDYRDAGGGLWVVDIRALLLCRKCLKAESRNAVVPVPPWQEFQTMKGLSLALPGSEIARDRLIFVCYRRAESQDVTGRIYDRLSARFGRDKIVRDVSSIPYGMDFIEFIRGILRRCSAVLVVVGPQWLSMRNPAGIRLLDDPADVVRREIEWAIQLGVPIIPILTGGAQIPPLTEIPKPIKALGTRNGIRVRPDPDFDRDIAILCGALESLIPSD